MTAHRNHVRALVCHLALASAAFMPLPAKWPGFVRRSTTIVGLLNDDERLEFLTKCGGVQKRVLCEAPRDAHRPPWGGLVRVHFTGRFPNGTIFDDAHARKPYEFQLNTGTVVDGMERGVRSMRPGERAELRCDPEWAYGAKGVGSRIDPNATLHYEVELLDWQDGPTFENDSFDMDTYRKSLEGNDVTCGQTDEYTWTENGEEVTLWLKLLQGEGKREVICEFRPRDISVRIGNQGSERVVVNGMLKGRTVPDDCYWVLEDQHPTLGRALQVVLSKAGAFTRWDGVIIGEPESDDLLR